MQKFGTDPEFFSVVEVYGKPFVISPALLTVESGVEVIGGNTKHPFFIETDEYLWMQDGVAWELTLKRPYASMMEMNAVIQTALNHLEDYLSKLRFFGERLALYKKPVVNIQKELYEGYLSNPEHKETVWEGFRYGCDTDYDAVNPEYVCVERNASEDPFRYGGGHIHTSGSPCFRTDPIPAIRCLAITAGNFVISESTTPDLERQRLLEFGRVGRYRPQFYPDGSVGVEYRTPSNSWVGLSAEKIEELDFWMRKALEILEKQQAHLVREFLPATIEAITNVDQNKARQILSCLKGG